jgi:DNA-binding NtrC family response regulator
VNTVRFGRCAAQPQLAVERDGFDLQLGIPLAWVSSRHAELSVVALDSRAFSFQLTDLDSRNGTTMEGRRLIGGNKLFPGQVFEIGRAFWMVREVHGRIDGQPGRLDPTGTVNPELRQLQRTLERLAPSALPVMLVGETGSGKDYLARAMHELSGREGPFIHANMTAGSLDSLLGGGGVGASPSFLDRARNGTIYIDEIAALSPDDQTRLLHLLGSASPGVGDAPTSDPRIIAASTRDVRPLVESGKFRPDLYARLAVYEARIPALRERREDLGLLVRRLSRTRDGKPAAVTTSAFRRLLGHRWPFNVRELSQTLQAALAVGERDDTVTSTAVEEVLRHAAEVPKNAAQIQEVRDELLAQLVAHRGNTAAVAASLECDQSEVHRWLRRFELDPALYGQHMQ